MHLIRDMVEITDKEMYRIVENFGSGKLWRIAKKTHWRKNFGESFNNMVNMAIIL